MYDPERSIDLMVIVESVFYTFMTKVFAKVWKHGTKRDSLLHPCIHTFYDKCVPQAVDGRLVRAGRSKGSGIPCLVEALVNNADRQEVVRFSCRKEPYRTIVVFHFQVVADLLLCPSAALFICLQVAKNGVLLLAFCSWGIKPQLLVN